MSKHDEYFHVNKNLLLLRISITVVSIGFWVLVETSRDCTVVEYQNLSGTHYKTVCEGKGY